MEKVISLHRQGPNEYHVLARPRGREGYDLLRLDREQLEKLRALIDLELGVDAEAERAFCERVADALWSKIATPDERVSLGLTRANLNTYIRQSISAARWATPLMHQAIAATTPPKSDFTENQRELMRRALVNRIRKGFASTVGARGGYLVWYLMQLDDDKLKEAAEHFGPPLDPKIVDKIFDNWPTPGSRTDPSTFRPGLYEHYRGGRYVALMLAEMHDTREKYVVYVSCQHETVNLRPWSKPGKDSWTDLVKVVEAVTTETLRGYERERLVPRFKFVGDK